VNRCVIATVLSALMVCFALGDVHGVSEQSGGTYKVDANWARLPAGTTWNGNTTWITADGRGQVVVLVRTAPYFRVLSRDGAWVKAFGEDGLFESAHSVTIDAQANLWVTDSAAHVVRKFSSDGRVLMTLGKKGVAGDNASHDLFNQPNHVAVAPNGDIYVSDGYVNARVVHFSGDGKLVRIIGGVESRATPCRVPGPDSCSSRTALPWIPRAASWSTTATTSVCPSSTKTRSSWSRGLIPPAAASLLPPTTPSTSAMSMPASSTS